MGKLKSSGGNRTDFVVECISKEPLAFQKIIDIGCAYGGLLNALSGKSRELVGVDMDESALEQAKANHPHIKFIYQSASTLPFEDETFDIAVLAEVIEHVGDENKQLVIDEAHRILKTGGLFVLTCPYAGLLAWMDPMDFKRRFPGVYRLYMRLTNYNPHTAIEVGHKHLSFKEIKQLFGHRFEFEQVRYCGFLTPFLTCVLAVNSRLHFLPQGTEQALNRFRGWESGFPCAQPLAFNIRLVARKK